MEKLKVKLAAHTIFLYVEICGIIKNCELI